MKALGLKKKGSASYKIYLQRQTDNRRHFENNISPITL